MNVELQDVVLLLLFGLAAGWWWRAHAVKELALQATREHCRRYEVQLLDESVVLRGLWLQRDATGTLRVRRSYTFEFTSTGERRHHGCTIMLGFRAETIQLEPHQLN